MITFISGNLFETNAQVVTNTVNCVGVMGKGVALEFKRRYPSLFKDYQARCDRGEVRLGEPYLWEDDATQVLNFPTKDHWRAHSKIEHIDAGLKYLANCYSDLGIHSIAMPPPGCGNGGLDWPVVKDLMVKYLGELPDLEVYVYVPTSAAFDDLDVDSGDDVANDTESKSTKIAAERFAEP